MSVTRTNSLFPSSLRKQGPITTAVDRYGSRLPQCPIETTRRMGPRVRGDDKLRRSLSPQNRPAPARLAGATQYAAAYRFNLRRLWDTGSPLEPVIGRRTAPTRWRG